MTLFMGTHQNRIDAKGRVSVPAPFRAALRAANGSANGGSGAEGGEVGEIILRPSHKLPCLEGWPPSRFHALATPLARLDLFSDDHDDLAAALYPDAYPIDPDKEGRIVLPADLTAHAGLTDAVAFMGVGPYFQIWEPAAAARRRDEARARARNIALPGNGRANNGPPGGGAS
jgi:MraZ protein